MVGPENDQQIISQTGGPESPLSTPDSLDQTIIHGPDRLKEIGETLKTVLLATSTIQAWYHETDSSTKNPDEVLKFLIEAHSSDPNFAQELAMFFIKEYQNKDDLRTIVQHLEASSSIVPEPLRKGFGPIDVELAMKGIEAWIDNIRGSSSLMEELGRGFFKHHSLEDPKNTAISILLALCPIRSTFNEADANRINNLHQACIVHTEYQRECNVNESRCTNYFELLKCLKLEIQKHLDASINEKIEMIEGLLSERADLVQATSPWNFGSHFSRNKPPRSKIREINRQIFNILAPEFVEALNSGHFSLNSRLTYCFSAFVTGLIPRHMKLFFQDNIDKAEISWAVSSCLLNTLWGTDLRRERERLGKSDFPF